MTLRILGWAAFAGTCIVILGCHRRNTVAKPLQVVENPRGGGDSALGNLEPHALKALKTLLSVEDWDVMRQLPEIWKKEFSDIERKSLVALLLERVDSLAPVKLTNYADLFVPSRLTSGKMKFHGHGWMVDQDIFLEGGRYAWALENLLSLSLPSIEEGLSKHDLDKRTASARSLVTSAIR